MKKLLLIITLLLATLSLCQCTQIADGLDFIGIPINGTSRADFHKELVKQSFTYDGWEGDAERFIGYYEGVGATILVAPDAEGNIEKVTVTMHDPDRDKMVFFTERISNQLCKKYHDYEEYVHIASVLSIAAFEEENTAEDGKANEEEEDRHLTWNYFRKKENGRYDYVSFGGRVKYGDSYYDPDTATMVIIYCPDTNKLDF